MRLSSPRFPRSRSCALARPHYLHQLEDPDDRVAILEFATEVEGERVEGIDILTFDEDGLITELKGDDPSGLGSPGRRRDDGRGVPKSRPRPPELIGHLAGRVDLAPPRSSYAG
jgi:hypothetical protein